ncbi:Holo-[acyl-carrier-protein] synthase [Sinobacterium norvegicum]|uniref:Holo-[acyl-carrier-protein] synthase n=1 Tax=Sinobacterium norvegicum TaxID=1641715 RepID=A0ABN8ED76_9GAMM|nr:holo-ACP synthase [Sinobacterium norvegicum]CAH0990411.1 Holo-[acyl-carrier-protein] synthase [Sinobacterium norvegicum]
MVVAIGTDLAKVSRVRDILQRRGLGFAQRILTATELQRYHQSGDGAAYLCRRFAAKEAMAKALGTGIGRGLSFQHIEILNNDLGAPVAKLNGFAAERMAELGANHCHVSISDEQEYALAFVVLSA